eukprot:CAMPEP_0197443572 /NCGR_PEP_ID=MMETSP1175-20131217/9280_1 /TAXON_ID=1003142 /ORGANISM="Triceratium dubium, Strain CCMP147" /LENGTH=76 /DNA_ID=CAMNT_0042974225 /DNA_START=778 /DNA_END=1005 /DNA_ORIENTATION=+
MCIDSHLGRFYDSFPGSEKSKVDWRTMLCTFLCLVYAEVAFTDPRSLLMQFYDIYSDPFCGNVTTSDMLRIVSVAA